jgi:hypothetical protein
MNYALFLTIEILIVLCALIYIICTRTVNANLFELFEMMKIGLLGIIILSLFIIIARMYQF